MPLESELISKLVELAKENSAQDARIQNYEYGEMQRFKNQEGMRLKEGVAMYHALSRMMQFIESTEDPKAALILLRETKEAAYATRKFISDLGEPNAG